MKKKAPLLIFLLTLSYLLNAENYILFEHYTTKQGLSQSTVSSIYQDKTGFMWFGTRDGLNRFDGYNFRVFRNTPDDSLSISANEISAITEDTAGNLWIGTIGGGVNIFNPYKETFLHISFSGLTYLATRMITSIFCDKDGNMWIGTKKGFFNAFISNNKIQLRNAGEYYNIEILKDLGIRNINQAKNGLLILATDHGMFSFNYKKGILKVIPIKYSTTFIYTSSFCEDEKTWWFGSFDYGLLRVVFDSDNLNQDIYIERFDANGYGYYSLPNMRIEAITGDRMGNMWVGTRYGLIKFDLKNKEKQVFLNNIYEPKSLSDNRINSLFVDNNQNLWIGMEYEGINKTNLTNSLFGFIKFSNYGNHSLNSNYISGITGIKKKEVYIGTDGEGIIKLLFNNDNDCKIEFFNYNNVSQLKDNHIISILQDNSGKIWVGSAVNALGEFDPQRRIIKYYKNPGFIFALHRGKENNLWIGTWMHGLYKFNVEKHTFLQYLNNPYNPQSLSVDIVLSLYEEDGKTLWVGTKGGGLNILKDLYCEPSRAKFEIYKHDPTDNNSISNNDINCITKSSDNTIWIGTSYGLNKVIKKPNGELTFKSYTNKNGLINAYIYGIIEDDNEILWLSTNKGIYSFDTRNEIFKLYDENDGLHSDEFRHNAYYKSPNGQIFFGGNNGIDFFFAKDIKESKLNSNIVFTNLKIPGLTPELYVKRFKQSISYTKSITLNYNDKEITIEFSSLQFVKPHKTKYKYRLKGFNEKWQELEYGKRSVTYTNLGSGNYVFQVISNENNEWDSKIAELNIKVLPPPWRTIWAYIFYALFLLFVFILFRKYTLIATKEKRQLLIEHIEKEKIEELSRLKIQFYTNVSHELRTPLTLINSPLEDLLNYENKDNYISQQLILIKNNVARLLSLVNQMLDFRKIDSGQLKLKITEIDIIPFIKDIYYSFDHHARSRNIKIHFIPYIDSLNIWIDPEKIKVVIYNIITNAIKFSPDNSNILIEINSKEKEFKPTGKMKKLMASYVGKRMNFAEIKVTDNGIGIEKSQQKKIFERFYQAIESPEKYGGSGIGLSISKEYVEMHGGTIEVESTVGKGSCFIISIPTGKDHILPSIAEILVNDESDKNLSNEVYTNTENRSETSVDKKKPNILFIEDNEELGNYLKQKLEKEYNIEWVNNGIKGIELAIQHNPDLIITDIMMPEMDGIEVCNKLKGEIQTSHIPVIILTAKANEESMVEGLKTGADVYISKPFSINVLNAQIKSLIETRRKLISNFNKKIVIQPKDITISSIDERFMKKLIDVMEEHLSNSSFSIKEMTMAMNMSHSVIFRKIKALTGMNVVEFIRSYRLKKAALILSKKKVPISEVSFITGFSDPKYFSKCFQKEFGMTPSEYAQNHYNEEPPII